MNLCINLDHVKLIIYVHDMFFVYISANRKNGTIYIGQTDDLSKRMFEHQNGAIPSFTKRYNCTRLVWFELHETRDSAVSREARMKEWRRAWKLRLIEKLNPNWDDLTADWTETDIYDNKRLYNPAYL